MTSRTRRRIESLSFSTRKTYERLATAKPSILFFAIIALSLSIFLLGGGIYDLLEKPLLAIPFQGRYIFYYPYTLHDQTLVDSITVMILYAIGFAGLLLTYQSTKYAYKPRQAFMLLLTGATLISIAFFYIEFLVAQKLAPL